MPVKYRCREGESGTELANEGTLPNLQLQPLPGEDEVIAVLTSDIHFSHKAPVFRSVEENWYEAMDCTLNQLRLLCREHQAPLIIAGDIFDSPRQPAQLVNFVLRRLPQPAYGVPGQHDLFHHRYEGVKNTPYWTLVEAGKLVNLEPDDNPMAIRGALLYGFPWGADVHPCLETGDIQPFGIRVAVIHSYIWTTKTGYAGAPEESRLREWVYRLHGYDVAVFGDNHKGFLAKGKDCRIINCGTLMRRKADEGDYQPWVGLLKANGTITTAYLNTSQDKCFLSPKEDTEQHHDFSEFMEELGSLGDAAIDFGEAVRRYLDSNKVSENVKQAILESLEEK